MKKYFFKSIANIILILISIVSLNYYMDTYGVFREKYTNRKTPANERYLKTKYILENKDKYDSFIFGSSRVGTLKGENLKNGKFYNMTFSGALPKEMLSILELFQKNDVKIKNIILGIDDFDQYTTPESQEDILYKLSYEKLNKNKFEIYQSYLLNNPFNKVNYEYFFGDKISNVDILDTGKWSRPLKDIEIEDDIQKHNLDEIFTTPFSNLDNISRVDKTIEEIRGIIKICNQNNIKLTVIFLPIHKTTFENNNYQNLEIFKNKLLELTDYWDFAELNKFTKNNYYWYEASHYRPILGELILKKIFKDDFEIVQKLEDEDNIFGKYISKN
ncbi:MAG: hypothetical protein ACRC0F_08855 [Cetobacterium sp.]